QPSLVEDDPLVKIARLLAGQAGERDLGDARELVAKTAFIAYAREIEIAAGAGDAGRVAALLKKASTRAKGEKGNMRQLVLRLLEEAAGRGDAAVTRALANSPFAREAFDEGVCGPLLSAAAGGHLQVIDVLLEKKPDLNARTDADGQYEPETY